MEQNAYFRAGAGAILYRPDGTIAIFKRTSHPAGVWQLQQGGIDAGERPETTLWRELKEEVGLTQTDIKNTTPYPRWTTYEYPAHIRTDVENPYPDRLGQCHAWWFLELKPDVDIDLNLALDQEFSEFEWADFATLINRTDDFKHHVYQELAEYFATHICQ